MSSPKISKNLTATVGQSMLPGDQHHITNNTWQFPLFIRSTDPGAPLTRSVSLLRLAGAVAKELPAIKRAVPLKSGSLLAEAVSSEARYRLINSNRSLAGVKVKFLLPANIDTCSGVISGIPVSTNLEELRDQLDFGTPGTELINMERIKNRFGKLTGAIKIVFFGPTLPQTIKLKNSPFFLKVNAFKEPPLRCFRCQGFGHTASKCGGVIKCARCSAGHLSRACTSSRLTCPNCGGSHTSRHRACTAFKNAVQISAIQRQNRVPWARACEILKQQQQQHKSTGEQTTHQTIMDANTNKQTNPCTNINKQTKITNLTPPTKINTTNSQNNVHLPTRQDQADLHLNTLTPPKTKFTRTPNGHLYWEKGGVITKIVKTPPKVTPPAYTPTQTPSAPVCTPNTSTPLRAGGSTSEQNPIIIDTSAATNSDSSYEVSDADSLVTNNTFESTQSYSQDSQQKKSLSSDKSVLADKQTVPPLVNTSQQTSPAHIKIISSKMEGKKCLGTIQFTSLLLEINKIITSKINLDGFKLLNYIEKKIILKLLENQGGDKLTSYVFPGGDAGVGGGTPSSRCVPGVVGGRGDNSVA